MKKTLTAAAVCAIVSPLASLTVMSQAGAAEGTNVSVGGYVRGQYIYQDPDVGDAFGEFGYRARLQFDSTTETSLGKVIGQLRVQGTNGASSGDANAGIDRALIRIGNFRFGYSDSWQTTFHGYGNSIERQDGDYGFDQAIFADYAGSIGGFKYGVGVQDTDDAGDPSTDADPYFGVGFEAAGFDVAVSYLHDTENKEGQYKLSAAGSFAGLNVNAWFRDQTGATRYSAGAAAGAPADNSSYGGSVKYAFSDAMALGLGYSENDTDDSRQIAATLFWDPVAGVNIRPEIVLYEDNKNMDVGFRIYRRF